MIDISRSFTPQKWNLSKQEALMLSYLVKNSNICSTNIGHSSTSSFAPSKEVSNPGQGLTAVEKIFNKNAVGVTPGKVLHAGSDVRVQVNIVGSQDTTGLMTAQELESMAATVISPIVDGAYQSGCHTASVWDKKHKQIFQN